MSDAQLREVERALALDPASLDLRRRHAHLLTRAGHADRALAAIDLAWRLGAEELWDELQAGLRARRIDVGPLTLCYVPQGAFVMGTEGFDADAAPPHLVELSAFYILARPLDYVSLHPWDGLPTWWRDQTPPRREQFNPRYHGSHTGSRRACEFLNQTAQPEALPGRYGLPTEAQWERVFRAGYLRPDGSSPYGVARAEQPEWVADTYDAGYYGASPRRDPGGAADGDQVVVRGIPNLPDPEYALYRDSARTDGSFNIARIVGERWVSHEHGIEFRAVFVPGPA